MRTVLRLSVAALLLMLCGVSAAHADEFRGLYVDAFYPHLGIKSHDQVTQMVNAAKAANFNALIVQVRKRGDAYYDSHVEPKASDIPVGYDPLADIITQAHALGMEVHAWLSVYEVSSNKYTNLPAQHITNAHPDWLMTDTGGKSAYADGKIFVDPGVPEVQDHFISVVKDILGNYAVDGINLDNIRYPSVSFGYNTASVSRFNLASGTAAIPKPRDVAWMQWRRGQVTALVMKVHDAIAEAKPDVRLSISVMGPNPIEASEFYLQDWHAWTKAGIVDFVIPMVYSAENVMQEKAPVALAHSYDRHVYIGIGGYRISSQEANRQVLACRSAGAKGVVFYSYHYVGPNSPTSECARMVDLLPETFSRPAAPPAMAWKE